MNVPEFINGIMLKIDDSNLKALKNKLTGEYIKFKYVSEDTVISKEMFAEKVGDYFEKIELKENKGFEKIIENFVNSLDTLVAYKLAPVPAAKKNEAPPVKPRVRKYYERAKEIIDSRDITEKQLIDYSRIMMCLRQAIIDSDYEEVADFEYSSECLTIDKFISSMRTQKDPSPLNIRKKLLFDTSELYSLDTCTFMLMYIVYYYLKSNELVGE